MGLIAPVPVADRERRPDTQPAAARDAVAILGPHASSREVADYAAVTVHAAWKQLRLANHRLGDVAAACDSISVSKMPRMLTDAAASADQLTVTASAVCERCAAPFTFTPRPSRPARRWCGPDCRRPVRQPAARHPPPIHELPDPPDFAKGTCTHVPASQASWWTSSEPALREAARFLCESCPILFPCASWAISALPAADTSVYGAMTGIERQRLKHEARQAAAASAAPVRR